MCLLNGHSNRNKYFSLILSYHWNWEFIINLTHPDKHFDVSIILQQDEFSASEDKSDDDLNLNSESGEDHDSGDDGDDDEDEVSQPFFICIPPVDIF